MEFEGFEVFFGVGAGLPNVFEVLFNFRFVLGGGFFEIEFDEFEELLVVDFYLFVDCFYFHRGFEVFADFFKCRVDEALFWFGLFCLRIFVVILPAADFFDDVFGESFLTGGAVEFALHFFCCKA